MRLALAPSAAELDAAFFAMVDEWRAGGLGCDEPTFDAHARALWAHQVERNEPYARFCAARGVSAGRPPRDWREIPAVPASAFKDATLATFDVARAELEFHTSGTTAQRAGVHYVERAALYDAALEAGFERFMLADGARLRYLNLVPNPRRNPHSSLGYMVERVSRSRGRGEPFFFLDGDALDVPGFVRALEDAIANAEPLCVTGTAFAFVALLERLETESRAFAAPAGSRVMETGGFKGRTRSVSRGELYGRIAHAFGIAQSAIVDEYGMTELLSQYYDGPASRVAGERIKAAPPWLRTLVIDADGREVRAGASGYLRHFDLANRSSVVAIQTEDLGYAARGGIVLLGRDAAAERRGCSLDAEDLRAGRTSERAR